MAALLGLELDAAEEIAREAAEDQVCAAANDNAPGQVVLSGHREAIDRAIELAKGRGAKRAIQLPVSAPFHCSLMAPAADVMADALATVGIKMPAVPLVANVTALRVSDPDEIRRKLVEQVTGKVRWRESVAYMASQGVETTVELGAGKVLTGLSKRIDRSLGAVAAGTPEELEKLLQQL